MYLRRPTSRPPVGTYPTYCAIRGNEILSLLRPTFYKGGRKPRSQTPVLNIRTSPLLYFLPDARAFNVATDQLAGPAWLRDFASANNYTIVATVPSDTTKEQFEKMLQNLLVERFHLVFHRETRNFPGYELVVDKGGPKFKEVTPTQGANPDPPRGFKYCWALRRAPTVLPTFPVRARSARWAGTVWSARRIRNGPWRSSCRTWDS